MRRAMAIELDLQRAGDCDKAPSDEQFQTWVAAALRLRGDAELTIRLVGREESRTLNRRYREKDHETNVLSFPAELPPGIDIPLLGDIVICVPLVEEEALEQAKPIEDHWAHLVLHGVLHLLGYDHVEEDEAQEMEALETLLLASLGIADPYA
jgi:probable rRNA maturation factor